MTRRRWKRWEKELVVVKKEVDDEEEGEVNDEEKEKRSRVAENHPEKKE